MKKIVALILSIALVCCCGLTVFAADSPVAEEKFSVTIRKAVGAAPVEKSDIEYTVGKDVILTLKADEATYGKFNSWSVYKVTESVDGVSAPVKSGIITLSAALNLTATTKTSAAVEGTDYTIISGSLTSKEITVKINNDVIVCANYDGKITDPLVKSNADNSANAPQTADVTVLYMAVIMLAAVAFGFGVKKVYSK